MIYDPGGEVILTATQGQLMIRLLAMMDDDQVDQMLIALKAVKDWGHGSVTIRVKNGRLWLADQTFTAKVTGTK